MSVIRILGGVGGRGLATPSYPINGRLVLQPLIIPANSVRYDNPYTAAIIRSPVKIYRQIVGICSRLGQRCFPVVGILNVYEQIVGQRNYFTVSYYISV